MTHPWMNITSNKSGGSGLINAPEFSSSAGALDWTREELLDELAIFQPAKGEKYDVNVEGKLRGETWVIARDGSAARSGVSLSLELSVPLWLLYRILSTVSMA